MRPVAMPVRRFLGLVTCAFVAALINAPAAAQSGYPAKPIRIIVPFAAGGPTDLLGRVAGDVLAKGLNGTVVVENRPGGGGNLGADLVAKATPDGYTLLLGAMSTLSLNAILYESLSYNPKTDFAHISTLGRSTLLLEVAADFPARTVREFVAHAKSRPEGLDYGSPGLGTGPHLVADWFRSTAGIAARAIPYRGTSAIIDAMLKGEVAWHMDTPNTASPLVRAGKARILAVTSRERHPQFPDVPTLIESGYPDFDAFVWFGLAAPARTPPEIVERLSAEVQKGIKHPDVEQRLSNLGMLAFGMSPKDMSAFIERENERWGKVIRAAGIKLQN